MKRLSPRRYLISCASFDVRVTVFVGKILDMEVVRSDGSEAHLYAYVDSQYSRLRDFAIRCGSMEEAANEAAWREAG